MGTGASVAVEAPVGKDEAQKLAGPKVLSNAPLRTHCSCRNNTDTFRVILLACVVSCVCCVCVWAREMANRAACFYYSEENDKPSRMFLLIVGRGEIRRNSN